MTSTTVRPDLLERLTELNCEKVLSERHISRGQMEFSTVLAHDVESKQYVVWTFNHTDRFLFEGDYFMYEFGEGATPEEKKAKAHADALERYRARARRDRGF